MLKRAGENKYSEKDYGDDVLTSEQYLILANYISTPLIGWDEDEPDPKQGVQAGQAENLAEKELEKFILVYMR